MEKGYRRQQDGIKNAIMDCYKRGVTDNEGNSIADEYGRPKAKPRIVGKIYVLRNGKLVEKGKVQH